MAIGDVYAVVAGGAASPQESAMLDQIAAEALADASRQTGAAYRLGDRTTSGESGSTFTVEADGEALLLKVEPGGRIGAHRRAAAACAHLGAQGYPAPRVLAMGEVPGFAYSLRTYLPGAPMDPRDGRHAAALIELVERQAGGAAAVGLLDPADWPGSVVDPVLNGGEGFCVLETMRAHSVESAALLDRVQALVRAGRDRLPPADDIVHHDFNPANILVESGEVTGVIDWEGVGAGDRAFDLAVLLFYAYAAPAARTALWVRLAQLRPPPAIGVYLAHICLRQAEWSLRRHAPELGRFYLQRAHAVLGDLARLGV
ncbi:MAG TPA: aminoglycoside phosphotransferase family protein [Caulobacteraceae bacterium]|jgi:aminoglycoside phosphotransferase (APT) family kinase protein